MRKGSALAAVLSACALLAACSVTGTPVDPAPVRAADRPVPPNVQENPAATSGSAAPPPPACNASASFRPGPLPPAGQMPAGSTMEKIQASGHLRAGVDQNTFLFGFRNPSTNALEGFDIDRVRDIALAIFGGDPQAIDQKIQYKVVTSAGRIPALKNGDVDIVVRTMTANCARWVDIDFSQIYYVAGQQVLIEKSASYKGLGDLGDKKVCAQRGSTSIIQLTKASPKPIVVATDTWSDCLVLLQQHEVEAVSTDDTILAGMAAQDPNTVIVGNRITDEPYGIGIPKGLPNHDMVRFVNGVLQKSYQDNGWATSYATWVGRGSKQAVPAPPLAQYQD